MNLPVAPQTRALIRPTLLHLAWIQAVVAMSGSLYFSEVMLFPPCLLCWYQRIAMYPLVAILGAVILKRDDKNARAYALPLSVIGLLIALYHCAMTYGLVEEGVCAVGAVSCTIRWINWYGFVTIPLMSMVAFTIITLSLIFHRVKE